MMDSQPGMHGHVPLGLRLVFEGAAADPSARRTPGSSLPDSLAASDRASGSVDLEWRLVGLLPEESGQDGAASGGAEETASRLSAGHLPQAMVPARMTLDRDEAEGYYLNLTSPEPSLFVLLRQQEVASATAARGYSGVPEAEAVTASYSEAARWMDGGMVVVRTALPEPMLAWIAEFAQYHFQVEGKKRRAGFRPSFLSREEFGMVARLAQEGAGPHVRQSASQVPDPHPGAGGVEASGR